MLPLSKTRRLASMVVAAGMLITAGLTATTTADAQSSSGPPSVAIEMVASGLTSPNAVVPVKDGTGRLFVVDQIGVVRVLNRDGTMNPEPFLDIRDRMLPLTPEFDERGLLGFAFHPNYARNGRFFVFYTAPLRAGAPTGWNATTTISEFQVSAGHPDRADMSSERILLQVDTPSFGNEGGQIAFGPDDGYLYIAIGDGGGIGNDEGPGHVEDWYGFNAGGNGQDVRHNLLGNILRIDVNHARPYTIPRDNPFVLNKRGLPEIYAYGLRNPYRMSFDQRGRHELYAADAGDHLWEEVNQIKRGGNYGWNVKEGTHCYDAANPTVSPATCPSQEPGGQPLIDPIVEYANATQPGGIGMVVLGGYIYRGSDLPSLQGKYIFGDWSTRFDIADGSMFVATPTPKGLWKTEQIRVSNTANNRLGQFILGFSQDLRGEVYVLTSSEFSLTGNTGKVFRLT